MTYSQMSHGSGRVSELMYLEQQIADVKKEIERATAAGLQDAADAASRLVKLEAERDKLED